MERRAAKEASLMKAVSGAASAVVLGAASAAALGAMEFWRRSLIDHLGAGG